MTRLERTKQGQFLPEHAMPYSIEPRDLIRDEKGCIIVDKREDCNWTVASINDAIRTCRETLMTSEDDGLKVKLCNNEAEA
eukprot:CAMPEP_0171312270 /NCGR_PEP_ID=MMETSP0816-20121228/22565_1 /TAXON_ID=420281 /ORGANISM="Proboscia inermis, Strain CCAP1064/1" /LENGTH=80 /DNA_ID=CAMNT_0011797573 /DNA_START=110 /DNA_END=352 /DNA_ORIENTATION=+